MTKGLIIGNDAEGRDEWENKYNLPMMVTYIFNADANIALNTLNDTYSKLLTLLNAYERILNLQHHIPKEIKTQIIKFHGHSMFSSQSIIGQKTFNPSDLVRDVSLDQLSIGKTIKVSFDQTNPESL